VTEIKVISVSQTFPKASSCVYCGKKPPGVELTLEHIIPDGLKGYLKLPDGSCKGCADITKRFEQAALRGVLGGARIHLGMWRKKEEQPQRAAVKVKSGDAFKVVPVQSANSRLLWPWWFCRRLEYCGVRAGSKVMIDCD